MNCVCVPTFRKNVLRFGKRAVKVSKGMRLIDAEFKNERAMLYADRVWRTASSFTGAATWEWGLLILAANKAARQ